MTVAAAPPPTRTATDQITYARQLVTQINELVETIAQLVPAEFEVRDRAALLAQYRKAFAEATERLASPTLTLATIGTTSSGKSTLVNALLGRSLAPIESGEMSAGIMTLEHADYPFNKCDLIVKKTPDANWETGSWTGISPDELLKRVSAVRAIDGHDGIMQLYRKALENDPNLVAPDIHIRASILPGNWPEALALPAGIGLKFLDLPGLRSLKDKQNLKIIQEQVGNAFSIVVLNYDDTDEQKRRQLLQEVKKVVDYLKGIKESMIFVLNKVDNRKATDFPVEHRITELKKEIKNVLELDEEPDILPMNALLLFYLQSAWGPSSPQHLPSAPLDVRQNHLHAFVKDCGATFLAKEDEDPVPAEWFLENRKMLRTASEDIELEQFRNLLMTQGYGWSYGEELWNRLQYRIQNSFTQLVILPSVHAFLKAFAELQVDMNHLINFRLEDSLEKLHAETQRRKQDYDTIETHLRNKREEIRAKSRELTEFLRKTQSQDSINFQNELNSMVHALIPSKSKFMEPINDIRESLLEQIIRPTVTGLQLREESRDIEDRLRDFLPQALANDIGYACGKLTRHDAYTQKVINDGGEFVADEANQADMNTLKQLEQDTLRVFQRLKEGLIHRAEFLLQTEAQNLEGAVRETLMAEQATLHDLSEAFFGHINDEAIKFNTESLADPDAISLPMNILDDAMNAEASYESTREEKYSVNKRTTHKRSCAEDRVIVTKEQKTRDIKTQTFPLLSAVAMGEIWSAGIDQVERQLLQELFNWMVEVFEVFSAEYSSTIRQLNAAIDRTVLEQQRRIQEQHDLERALWFEIRAHLNRSHESAECLHQI